MSDLGILGLAMSGVVLLTGVVFYFLQNRQFRESHQELKMFQMENARIIQQMEKNAAQRHADSMQYLEGMWGSLGRVIRKQEEGEGGSAK